MEKETTKLVHIGFIRKAHGNNGQLLVSLVSDRIIIKNDIDIVWLGSKPDHTNSWIVDKFSKNKTTAFLKLRDINSIEEANYLKGLKVYLSETLFSEEPFTALLGFDLISADNKDIIGKIIEIDFSNIQAAFIIETVNGSKIQAPAVSDLIQNISREKECVYYKTPKGLFNEN
ncbi:MAG: hypothetical protein K9M80_04270 [Candidatus Marinimicrobia bacterium]|nr:hypothetical protein [Candidatus Neomarinimicrobiota bacterium]